MREEQKLYFNPMVKELVESFSYCFDVKVTFYSTRLDEWLVGYHSDASDYCFMIQKGLGVRYRCLSQDRQACARCTAMGRPFSYRCHGGLAEAVIPIVLDGKTVAFAMVGQFRMTEEVPQSVLDAWKEQGCGAETLEKAFHDRPFFTGERLSRMLRIFSAMLSFMTNSRNMKVEEADVVDRIMEYIEDHIGDAITITEVAKSIGRSPSSITHTLKDKMGYSFKDMVISRKIARFEQNLARDPSLTIRQGARMVGYEDALYFSRLYRKKRSMTPSGYVEMLRKTKNETGENLWVDQSETVVDDGNLKRHEEYNE